MGTTTPSRVKIFFWQICHRQRNINSLHTLKMFFSANWCIVYRHSVLLSWASVILHRDILTNVLVWTGSTGVVWTWPKNCLVCHITVRRLTSGTSKWVNFIRQPLLEARVSSDAGIWLSFGSKALPCVVSFLWKAGDVSWNLVQHIKQCSKWLRSVWLEPPGFCYITWKVEKNAANEMHFRASDHLMYSS